jgi:hypothetical protein
MMSHEKSAQQMTARPMTEFEKQVALAVRDRRDPWRVGRGAGQALGRLMTKGIVFPDPALPVDPGERFKLTPAGVAALGGEP